MQRGEVGEGHETMARFFMHWRNGDHETAYEIAERFIDKADAGQKTIVLYSLARSQIEHGRYDAAMGTLRTLQDDLHYSGPRPFFYCPSYFLLGESVRTYCHGGNGERRMQRHRRQVSDLRSQRGWQMPNPRPPVWARLRLRRRRHVRYAEQRLQ